MPKISVIIPIYNVEPYLARCLDSVCNQTLKDIEIICINDCSLDNSLAILKDYANKDSRIKIIDFKENKGVSIARNTGIKEAKGEYLAFVDSDDFIDLNFCESLYNIAIEENADMAKCECITRFLDKKEEKSKLNSLIKEKGKYFFMHEWWCAIYKRDMIIENSLFLPENMDLGEDIVFLNACVLKANKLALVEEVYYHYIRVEESLNSNKLTIKRIKSALLACNIILKELDVTSLCLDNNSLYASLYDQRLNYILALSFQNDLEEAKKLCASNLVNLYQQCKCKEELNNVFIYKNILEFMKNKEVEELAKEILKYKSAHQMFISQLRTKAQGK